MLENTNVDYFIYKKEEFISFDNNAIFIICDVICDNAFLFEENIINLPRSRKVLLFDYVYNYHFSNAAWVHQRFIQGEENESGVVAIGTSHFRLCFNCPEIHNYANMWQDFYFDYQILRKLLANNDGRIRQVIWGIYLGGLFYDMSVYKYAGTDVLLYYPEFKELENFPDGELYGAFYDHEDEVIKKLLKINYKKLFYEYYYKGKTTILNYGDQCLNDDEYDEKTLLQIKTRLFSEFTNLKDDGIVEENKRIIQKILLLLKEKGIKVLIVFAPTTDFYKINYPGNYFERTKAYMAKCKEDFDFELLDLSEDKLPNEFFYDYNHLNTKGAEYVQEKLRLYLI